MKYNMIELFSIVYVLLYIHSLSCILGACAIFVIFFLNDKVLCHLEKMQFCQEETRVKLKITYNWKFIMLYLCETFCGLKGQKL